MTKKELTKRYLLFIISLFFAALGVAITKHAELGVSPTSSVANIFSCKYPVLSLGTWLIIWNCLLILGQFLILRKDFKLIQLLQVPLSFIFGYFTDLGMWIVSFFPVNQYIVRIIFVLVGVTTLSFGVSLAVIANVVMNSAEAFVKAVSDKLKQNFGNVKIGFDVICVIISVVLSLLFFNGKIVSTREGTIISALLTGLIVKFFTRILKEPLDGVLNA